MGCDSRVFPACFLSPTDFNPRSPNGLRPIASYVLEVNEIISIHAARMGCDSDTLAANAVEFEFQSTQPEWAATSALLLKLPYRHYFNPRSPNGLRPVNHPLYRLLHNISIHAARMGCDRNARGHIISATQFQSTQPEWAATGP